jgi:hypothetical protein
MRRAEHVLSNASVAVFPRKMQPRLELGRVFFALNTPSV